MPWRDVTWSRYSSVRVAVLVSEAGVCHRYGVTKPNCNRVGTVDWYHLSQNSVRTMSACEVRASALRPQARASWRRKEMNVHTVFYGDFPPEQFMTLTPRTKLGICHTFFRLFKHKSHNPMKFSLESFRARHAKLRLRYSRSV